MDPLFVIKYGKMFNECEVTRVTRVVQHIKWILHGLIIRLAVFIIHLNIRFVTYLCPGTLCKGRQIWEGKPCTKFAKLSGYCKFHISVEHQIEKWSRFYLLPILRIKGYSLDEPGLIELDEFARRFMKYFMGCNDETKNVWWIRMPVRRVINYDKCRFLNLWDASECENERYNGSYYCWKHIATLDIFYASYHLSSEECTDPHIAVLELILRDIYEKVTRLGLDGAHKRWNCKIIRKCDAISHIWMGFQWDPIVLRSRPYGFLPRELFCNIGCKIDDIINNMFANRNVVEEKSADIGNEDEASDEDVEVDDEGYEIPYIGNHFILENHLNNVPCDDTECWD